MTIEISSEPFRVFCKNDGNKPSYIKDEEWISKNEEYIVLKAYKHLISGDTFYKLYTEKPVEHDTFVADRFVRNQYSVN